MALKSGCLYLSLYSQYLEATDIMSVLITHLSGNLPHDTLKQRPGRIRCEKIPQSIDFIDQNGAIRFEILLAPTAFRECVSVSRGTSNPSEKVGVNLRGQALTLICTARV